MRIFYYIERLLTHAYSILIAHRFKRMGNGTHIQAVARCFVGLQNVVIGSKCEFGSNLILTVWGDGFVIIGDNCHFGDNNQITASNGITIGNNLLTGSNVLFSDNSHGQSVKDQLAIAPILRPLYSKGPIKIGDNVWLGQNCCILGGITIGDSAIIGANSVVTHDVPANCIVAGVPAKIIKEMI